MVSINYATREVSCKIVFYGPGLSGKTTNLQYVHLKVPSNTKGKLISLATDADRTLYFDFLPINIGTINGFASKFQLYTVPGSGYTIMQPGNSFSEVSTDSFLWPTHNRTRWMRTSSRSIT